MPKEKIPVYCVPGLAADVSIFEFIRLPEEFELYTIPWQMPIVGESLEEYAIRFAKEVKHDNAVLIGVSFGGIMVQEMSAFLNLRKLIIISSVKTRKEFPLRLHLMKKTKVYKIFPTTLVGKMKYLEQIMYGDTGKKIAQAYEKYLTVTNKDYLDWAIKSTIEWGQEIPLKNVVHIHGALDRVFPVKNIKDCIVVPKATHAMILRRSRWFNEQLPKLILN